MRKKNSFVKHILTLLTGTGLGQVITVLSAPILTRLFSPEEYGIFSYFVAMVAILTITTTLRYERAIVIKKNELPAYEATKSTFIVALVMSIIILVILFLSKNFIEDTIGVTGFSAWYWLVPIGALVAGSYNILNSWFSRAQRYKMLAVSRTTRATGIASVQIVGGLLKIGYPGLIIGQIVGQLTNTGYLLSRLIKENRSKAVPFIKMKNQLIINKSFPLYTMPYALMRSISQNSMPFFLGFLFSSVVVGFYALALRLIQMPAYLIADSVTQVYLERASKIYHETSKITPFLIKVTVLIASVSILPFIVVFLFAPEIFGLILGDDWYEAGQYSSWLTFWLFFVFVNRPVIAAMQIADQQKYLFPFELITFASQVITLYISSLYLGPVESIMYFSLVGGLFNVVIYFICYTLIKRKESIAVTKGKRLT